MSHAPIVEEMIQLAQVNAPSRGEREMVDLLTQRLQELGCDVWEDGAAIHIEGGTAGNLHACLEGTLPGAVLFVAHLDRVQNGGGIHPQIQGDLLVSDGSTILAADDLAGVCAILDGLCRVHQTQTAHPRIEILLTVCEEIGLQGSRYVDLSRHVAKMGYVLDSPGPTGRVLDSAMGKAELFLDVKGRAAHCAYPELGISATRAVVLLLAQLEDGRIDEETVANWSTLLSPTPCNTIPEQCHAQAFLLSRNFSTMERYIARFEETAQQIQAQTGAEIIARSLVHYPPFSVPEDSPTIRRARSAMEELGIPARVEHGAGGCDANRLNDQGIQCVALATGYSKNHTKGEQLSIPDLIQAGALVERLMAAPVEG